MADMIKFFKGLEASLPTTGVNGALYITTDEGAIYLGTGTGMKRLGDFVQVNNVASLPAKAHESCLYYCVAENILAKWNGAEWKQINKQPTAEELKGLLGLGALAYKSEVAEGDLNADLAAKINASTAVNHSHDNKALLDTYTQTEADLADAVAKKHTHTFVEVELNKIAEGDVAKWNGVVADHLTAADKTALENSIKEAKQAGTDANTNIEAYKVTNDARVKAVEDDLAEITATEGGILAQAKAYADGKDDAIAAAKKAGDDAQDTIDAYIESNNAALAGVKATAEAAATKTYTDEELAKKVDKVGGKSLVDDAEITKLAGVSAGANKVETSDTNGNIKVDGAEVVVYTHPASHTVSEISDFDAKIKAYDYATKTELGDVDAKFADYKTAADQRVIDDEQDRRLGVIEGDYLKAADIANFETKENVKKVSDALDAYIESNDAAVADRYTKAEADGKFALIADAYDDEEVRGLISDNADAIAAEKERAEAAEEGLQTQINTIMNNPDAEGAINSINEFTQYVKDHGTIADGFRTDIDKNKENIAANAKAIEDEVARADAAEKVLAGRLDTLEAIDHDAYVAADATLKTELEGKITDGDAATLEAAKTDASNKDAVVLAEAQAYADQAEADAVATAEGKVNALADNVYTKEQTYTQDEVNALLTWGEF